MVYVDIAKLQEIKFANKNIGLYFCLLIGLKVRQIR